MILIGSTFYQLNHYSFKRDENYIVGVIDKSTNVYQEDDVFNRFRTPIKKSKLKRGNGIVNYKRCCLF